MQLSATLACNSKVLEMQGKGHIVSLCPVSASFWELEESCFHLAAQQQQNLLWLALFLQRLKGRQRTTDLHVLSVQGRSIVNQLPVVSAQSGPKVQFTAFWAVSLLAASQSSQEPTSLLPTACLCFFPAHSLQASAEELLSSQDSWAQAGEAERQESTDGVRRARDFRWKQLAALERKRHSSLAWGFETSAETEEELQPQRDLLKKEAPLAVPKVCCPQGPSPRGLERLLQEFSRQGDTLSQVCREKTVLAQEKAALEARLADTERKLRGLSKQLVEARSAKESLQSRLQAAQLHISELEMARSRLEGQVCTATQAKEVILEGLCRELQAVRSLSKQQREEVAQHLRWTEEQYIKAL
ncbi:uncharacterized protein LOC134558282 [Prinia subflava]|uniref:uncharacterized protein LOC134558282 n=1 Tax=Prinia subflava TaxID=208062 RepID=UPI002FDFF0C4